MPRRPLIVGILLDVGRRESLERICHPHVSVFHAVRFQDRAHQMIELVHTHLPSLAGRRITVCAAPCSGSPSGPISTTRLDLPRSRSSSRCWRKAHTSSCTTRLPVASRADNCLPPECFFEARSSEDSSQSPYLVELKAVKRRTFHKKCRPFLADSVCPLPKRIPEVRLSWALFSSTVRHRMRRGAKCCTTASSSSTR